MIMLKVHYLGKNQTMAQSLSGGVTYLYEYKRSLNNGATYATFSNDLEELKTKWQEEEKENIIK